MVNEVEKDLDEEEKYEKEEYPLSPADWIMFLSGKVSDCRANSLTFGAMTLAVMLVCLSGTIAFLGGDVFKLIASYLLAIFSFLLLIGIILHVRHVNQRIKPIEKIIKDIIYRELKNHEDVLKRCEDAEIFKCKKD